MQQYYPTGFQPPTGNVQYTTDGGQLTDIRPGPNIFFQPPTGKVQYTTDGGQLREIRPGPNIFFISPTSRRTMDPQKRQEMKQSYCQTFNISPNSKIFNYYFKDVILLQKIYEAFISPEVLQSIQSSRNKLQTRMNVASKFFLGYSLYLFTVGSMMKWARLTSFKYKYFILLYAGSLVVATPYVMAASEAFNTINYHQQYQKILDLYEKDANIS